MKNEYHIDVTPEEDMLFRDQVEKKNVCLSKKPNKIFCIVAAAHVVIIGALITTSYALEQKKPGSEIDFEAPVSEVQEFKHSVALPVTETPISNNSIVNQTSNSTVVSSAKKSSKKTSTLATHYIVKKGDTISNIATTYKLSSKKLLEINGIKDPNKIFVGQKLVFIKK